MKNKIMKKFGAMLLAGTMIVTGGNVTTYAQSEDGAEVTQEQQNEELYGIDTDEVKILEEGDGFFICNQSINGKERVVAHLWMDKRKSKRTPDEILQSILKSKLIDENSIVALTTRYTHITIPKSVVETLKEKNIGLGIVMSYYDSYEYDELYFDKISELHGDESFRVQYDSNTELLDKLSDMGIDGYMFTINNDENTKKSYDTFYGDGLFNQKKLIDRNLCIKDMSDAKLKVYYYDDIRCKYIPLNSKVHYSNLTYSSDRKKDGVEYTVVGAAIKSNVSGVNYYGTYLVCNNALPDSMVFNLTGLEKNGDNLIYYKNGLKDKSFTGLCDYNGNKYYVKNGKVDYSASMLYDYNGSTWNINNGKVDKTQNLRKKDGTWFYIQDGKITNTTTLCKYNGSWWYVNNGKVDYSATTLCKYNGSWWYVENGKVNFNKTGLCKYNGSWWYVSGGRVNFNATGLCKYNGSWWYVSGGRVNFNATGLCKYNGSWWYVSGGRVNFNTTGLCKYNGSWWYVSGGRVNFNATGLCKYNGSWWYVSGGRVNFNATGLCKYNGTWWYVNNGVVNFNKTTLCKYGKNWYAVSKGKVAWNYTGYINYNGRSYKVVNGVVKF